MEKGIRGALQDGLASRLILTIPGSGLTGSSFKEAGITGLLGSWF